MAEIFVTGNAGSDPELRFTPSGQAVAVFSVAENRKWKDANGEPKEVTTWWRIQCWRELAENVSQSIAKGDRVMVWGRVDIRDYEDDEGNQRRTTEINAFEVGPALRWATAKVEKNERTGSGGGRREDVPLPDDEPF